MTLLSRVEAVTGPGGMTPLEYLAKYNKVQQQDIPGLWRINDGPEIATFQLLAIARENLAVLRAKEGM